MGLHLDANGLLHPVTPVGEDGARCVCGKSATDTLIQFAPYSELEALRRALADCGTHYINADTCGVCRKHLYECDAEYRTSDDAPRAARELACPGARARKLLRETQ